MEKFGIFELLDALSALTAREGEGTAPEKQTDAAYRPPVYGESAPPAESSPSAKADALAGFYARHDAVARKAEKK